MSEQERNELLQKKIPPEYWDKPPRIKLALKCGYFIDEIKDVIDGKKKFSELEKVLNIWVQPE